MVIWEFGVYSRHSGQRRGADGPCSVDGSTSLLVRTWRSGSGLFLRCCRIRVAILYAWAASEDFGVSLLFMLILVSCLWRNVTVCMGEPSGLFRAHARSYSTLEPMSQYVRQARWGFEIICKRVSIQFTGNCPTHETAENRPHSSSTMSPSSAASCLALPIEIRLSCLRMRYWRPRKLFSSLL